MAENNFDVVIIGGGPGGYVAAIRAQQLGLKTALVEKQHLGGVCLNWGCIPTKALLRSAEIYTQLQHLPSYGLSAEKISFDLKAIVARSRHIAQQLSQGVRHLMKKNQVTVIEGEGVLKGKSGSLHIIDIQEAGGAKKTLTTPHVVLATGARARTLPGLEPDNKFIWTAKEAMIPEKLPESLLVIGSGAIGIEFASFYNAFGVKVHVIELQDKILPNEDEEISAFARKAFEKKGMNFYTGTLTEKIEKGPEKVKVILKTPQGQKALEVSQIIVAVGIVGNTEGLGLEKTKVQVNKGHIVTHAFGRTDEPGIYAIGDVAGAPWLAHKASHEGILCIEALANKHPHEMDRKNIPGCTYSLPQIASIGMTESQAKAAGKAIRVGRFPFIGNGKAIALGEAEGLIKTVFDEKTGELLGAHMVGSEVTELIQGFGIAKTLEATEAELMHTIFAHPTLSEMMHESVLNAYGRTLHF